MLPVVVTTCKKYKHLLPDFFDLLNKFWDDDGRTFIVDVARPYERWTEQLHRVVVSNNLQHFIRLSEDFYFNSPVDNESLSTAETCAKKTGAFRFSLQCVSEGFTGQTLNEVEKGIYSLKQDAPYSGSMEASIFNGSELRKVLEFHFEHVWDFEQTCTNYIKEKKHLVLVPEKRIFSYKDATRRGETRVKKENGQYLILKPGDVWEPFV